MKTCKTCSPESIRTPDTLILKDNGDYFLYLKHYTGKTMHVLIRYCPFCGRKLEEKNNGKAD